MPIQSRVHAPCWTSTTTRKRSSRISRKRWRECFLCTTCTMISLSSSNIQSHKCVLPVVKGSKKFIYHISYILWYVGVEDPYVTVGEIQQLNQKDISTIRLEALMNSCDSINKEIVFIINPFPVIDGIFLRQMTGERVIAPHTIKLCIKK